jgi:hypothetical protein
MILVEVVAILETVAHDFERHDVLPVSSEANLARVVGGATAMAADLIAAESGREGS